MKKRVQKILVFAIGWFFILLGVIGLFLPFLQGILFIAIGFLILSKESRWAKKMFVRLRRRYPEQYERLEKFRQRISSLFKR